MDQIASSCKCWTPHHLWKKFLLQGSDRRGHLTDIYIFTCALSSSWTFRSDLMKSESAPQAAAPWGERREWPLWRLLSGGRVDTWGPSHLAVLPRMVLARHCVFPYRLRLSGQSASDVPIGTVFPTAFACFVSLSHMLLILRIFHTLPPLLMSQGELWSAASDATPMAHWGIRWSVANFSNEVFLIKVHAFFFF